MSTKQSEVIGVALARVDPQALITKALESGASVETLERLVTLAKDVRQVTAREAWYDAMAAFQRTCPAIKKDSTAKIATRSGGSYSYSYAALDTILSIVQPLLGELGLSLSWRQKHEAQAVSASCVVSHKLGHSEESGFITMPYGGDDGRMNPAQRVGSALTYARRYSLLAILGLAPEDDDDAVGSVAQTQFQRPVPSTDPEAHRTEAGALFPDPAPDKEGLIAEIRKRSKDIPAGDKAEAAETYLGGAKRLEDADVAQLSDLLGWLKARQAHRDLSK